MKVLFIYKFLTLGGVESVLRTRLIGLSDFGVDPCAWFLSDGPGAVLFEDQLGRVMIGDPEQLGQWIFDVEPEIVSVIDTEEVLPVLATLGESVRFIIEVHSPYRENRIYLYWLSKLRPRGFFAPSRYQADIVQRRVGKIAPVSVIPNPVAEGFANAPTPFEPPPPGPVIAWVGRLDALKDWKACIRAMNRLAASRAEAELWMVGEPQGPRGGKQFYDYARRQGVLARLRWYPSMRQSSMPRLFDAVRDSGGVVLSTSHEESFGLSVAEAMARECAVVAPRSGPFPEFIDHGVMGRLYPPGDMRQAAREVAALLDDAEARRSCGRTAREAILARHAPEVALRILADGLRRIAADEPQAKALT